jgi:ribosomal protein L15E
MKRARNLELRALFDQQIDHVYLAIVQRVVERRRSILILRVDFRPRREQRLRDLGLAFHGSGVERRHTILRIHAFRIGSLFNQQLHHRGFAAP